MEEWKEKKEEAEASAKGSIHLCSFALPLTSSRSTETDRGLKEIRPLLAEYQEHLRALESGETFTPRLTGKDKGKKSKSSRDEDEDEEMSDASGEESSPKRGKKRKNDAGSAQRSAKRRKSTEEDDFIVDDDDDEELTFSDDESEGGLGPEDSEFDEASDADKDEDDEEEEEEEENDDEEEVTEESLKAKIAEVKEAITIGRTKLSEFRQQRKEAVDKLASLKKRESRAQREKNAFCSKKRSEVSFARSKLLSSFLNSISVFARRTERRFPYRPQGSRW